MKHEIQKINESLEPLRNEIVNHPVYDSIKTLTDLNVFMEYHVYAVWDFMSLLKSLQNTLTCTQVPWYPKGSADTRFLINEIVVGEESDVDLYGKRKSHYEMYLEAMEQSGANTQPMNEFAEKLASNLPLKDAFKSTQTPQAAQEFVDFTFSIIGQNKPYLQAAIFTFGREELIPDMFMSIVNDLHQKFPNQVSLFKYYLERHIEVDGGHHGELALQMTTNLCGNDPAKWEQARIASIQALTMRKQLWDGVYEQIQKTTPQTQY